MDPDIEAFWESARRQIDGAPEEAPQAWAFGDSPELADELLELVLAGTKTATCDAVWRFKADDEPIPQPGDFSIILDGADRPRCVIETTEARVLPMNEVDEQFAYDEGEGDRSREYWYAAHERFFRRILPNIDREFDPTMPLVLERFRLRFP